jgi:hypothetical protein
MVWRLPFSSAIRRNIFDLKPALYGMLPDFIFIQIKDGVSLEPAVSKVFIYVSFPSNIFISYMYIRVCRETSSCIHCIQINIPVNLLPS